MFGFFKKKDKQTAPEKASEKVVPIKPAPESKPNNDSIITMRQGIDRKKANMQKLRETLNGCLPPDERKTEDGADQMAQLAMALNRSRR